MISSTNFSKSYLLLLVFVILLILYNGMYLFKELFRKHYNKLESIYDTMKE